MGALMASGAVWLSVALSVQIDESVENHTVV